jgi:rifampicin phosphotransferase
MPPATSSACGTTRSPTRSSTASRGSTSWPPGRPSEHGAKLTRDPRPTGRSPDRPPPLDALPEEARLANKSLLWYAERIFEAQRSSQKLTDDEITGLPASPGQYQGPARIVRGPEEFAKIEAGDVLVCPITSPVWSVLFPSIGALVTDTGGVLSHPAIIARECGVPAVVATGNATQRVQDGQVIEVDGAAGLVTASG